MATIQVNATINAVSITNIGTVNQENIMLQIVNLHLLMIMKD